VRSDGRAPDELRPLRLVTDFTENPLGSVLCEMGRTKVLCTVCHESGVPRFLQGSGQGWVTAEYSLLPGSTDARTQREAARGKQGGRTLEIQRLIGRSMRAVADLEALGERQITVDCDVIQADGGTRTAAITGGWVALHDCLDWMHSRQMASKTRVLKDHVAAVSCGIFKGEAVADLDYDEDSAAETDANFVMTGSGGIVEVQGTAEGEPFSRAQFDALFGLAEKAIADLVDLQKQAIGG